MGVGLLGTIAGKDHDSPTSSSRHQGSAYFRGIINAFWADSVTIRTPSKQLGTRLRVKAAVVIDGEFNNTFVESGGDIPNGRDAYTSFAIEVTGPGIASQVGCSSYETLDGTGQSSQLPNAGYIDLDITYYNGEAREMKYEMKLFGSGQASTYLNAEFYPDDPGQEAGALFDADFMSTTKWGGISGVFDADTGEEITDWTVSSDSGFDYSQPYVVPEPAALSLLAIGGLAMLARRRRWG